MDYHHVSLCDDRDENPFVILLIDCQTDFFMIDVCIYRLIVWKRFLNIYRDFNARIVSFYFPRLYETRYVEEYRTVFANLQIPDFDLTDSQDDSYSRKWYYSYTLYKTEDF